MYSASFGGFILRRGVLWWVGFLVGWVWVLSFGCGGLVVWLCVVALWWGGGVFIADVLSGMFGIALLGVVFLCFACCLLCLLHF